MKDKEKTKEELNNELQELQRRFNDLMVSSERIALEHGQTVQKLLESEKKLEVASKLAQLGYWELGHSNSTLLWSEGIYEMFEVDSTQFEATYEIFLNAIHPDDRDRVNKAFSESVLNKTPYEITHRLLMPDGRIKWVIEICRTEYDDENKPICSYGIVQDITSDKLEEEQSISRDHQFRKLSSNIPDLIYQFTRRPDGRYVVPIASEGIKNIFGCSPEDVIDDFAPIADVIYQEDTERVISEIEYSARNLSYFTCEFRVQIPGRDIQWILSRATPEKLADGSVTWYGFNADITEKKRIEQELTEAKEEAEQIRNHLDNIINNIGDPLFVKDEQSRLQRVNNAFCTMFGLQEEEIIGKTLAEDVEPEERDSFLKIDRKVLSDGEENISEETMTVRGGATRIISTKKTRFADGYGRKYLVGVIRDITSTKEAELELRKSKEQAEESERLKSAFLANMSHEIRTPMNGIFGFTELLKDGGITASERVEYIDIIEKSGRRMLNIINNIVDISKIEAGLMKVYITETNVNEQIRQIYDFFSPDADKQKLDLRITMPVLENDVILATDSEKLFAILTNLVKNAIKYTDSGFVEIGFVVKSEDKSDEIEFFVEDSGIGIPENRAEAIFDRFFQVDVEDRMALQGSGLGLSIAKSYVDMLGGSIWVKSKFGVGSTFYFTLPYKQEQKSIVAPQDVVPEQNVGMDSIRNIRILIAEDDEQSAILLSYFLKPITNDLVYAKNGLEAVEICRADASIDLILMDIKMPVMGGYTATKTIREFNTSVKIIAQTAFGHSEDRQKAMDVGCDDYLTKPINKELLYQMIASHVSKT